MDTPAERLGQFFSGLGVPTEGNVFRINTNEPEEIRNVVIEKVAAFLPSAEVMVEPFSVGDYIFRDIVFERKSLDFSNYQLVRQQCVEMLANFRMVYILVDVDRDDVLMHLYENNPSKAEGLNGFIASLMVMGVTPVFCSDPESFAEIMVKRCSKGMDLKDRMYREPIREKGSDSDEILHIVKSISGISTERGRRLLDRFRTVSGISSASIQDLSSVEGIGPKTAKNIYEAFRKEWKG